MVSGVLVFFSSFFFLRDLCLVVALSSLRFITDVIVIVTVVCCELKLPINQLPQSKDDDVLIERLYYSFHSVGYVSAPSEIDFFFFQGLF